ncbi:hypothetical protein F2P81_022656 [Scophthalmus maximus]|uniref:Uncharacterized protein n=1 Tax=Scophthalmus maximus TaxID=52904 RepID=A0A6A4S0L4_SCOMX|nr:hypothetical protein F2P81_022656 [Scophthalmus maximus]
MCRVQSGRGGDGDSGSEDQSEAVNNNKLTANSDMKLIIDWNLRNDRVRLRKMRVGATVTGRGIGDVGTVCTVKWVT